MKEIQLTRNMFAIVDDEDYEHFMQWKWHATKLGYAVRKCYKNGRNNPKYIHMHRLALGVETGVDHKNGNPRDNRKENLRLADQQQNGANHKRNKNNKSGFKGVSLTVSGTFEAYIHYDYKKVHLGRYTLAEDAAKAYDAKAKELFGEYAHLNFTQE